MAKTPHTDACAVVPFNSVDVPRGAPTAGPNHEGDCDFVEGDITKAADLEKAFDVRDIDTVFHLAASVGNKRSIDFPISDSEINVLGTLNVLEEALKRGVKKLVASSSEGISGELKALPIVEEHPIDRE